MTITRDLAAGVTGLLLTKIEPGRINVKQFSLTTAEYDLGTLGVAKRFAKLHIHYSMNGDTKLSTSISLDGNDFVEIDNTTWGSTFVEPDSGGESTDFSVKTIDLKSLDDAQTIKVRIRQETASGGGASRTELLSDFRLSEIAIIYRKKNVK
tara:strand:+ start:70 stop:525 length:456 start_codon:yes stop_codon:yes gene_type:complete